MLKSISLRLCTLIVLLFAGIYSFAQQVQVKGTVVEKSSGESIIGASVMEVGSNSNGTITDIDGNFTLSVASGATLSVSYIGYKTVTVKARPTLRIELTEDSQLIDEVVVTGYMSEKKASLTGSVAVVKMKDVADIPTGNVLSSLQGRVAGMNITTDGTPGGGNTSTLVRGKSSFRNDANSPLYVIDGVMTRENISSILSSNDVESIQVLKDAASASIYGAQAANGVIIITTKRAKKGETRVDFDMSLTLQTYQCGFDMLNADAWGQVYWSAYKYANNGATPSSEIYGNGATPQLQDYIGLNGAKVHAVDTDWRDVVYRTALMQNYSATLSKGSDNGAFSLALNYLDHDGLVENTNFQRINTRISSNYHYLDNRLRIGENVAINRWTQTLSPAGVDENAIKQHPAKTVYDENGNYNDAINDVLGDAPNMARLLENEKQNKHDYWRIFGNAFLEIEPIKNLVLKTNFGMNYYDETNKTFEPAWARDEVNKLTQSSNKRLDWVWTNTVTYSKAFGKNNLTALLGTEAKKNHSESMFGYGTGLAVEDEDYIYLDGVTAGKNVGAGASNYGMVSYFGKVNYDYEGRYLASVTVRRDASSRLAKGNNVDYFPSVSAGWRISSEKFMEATRDWLADLKLRASWGVNGNDIIDNEAPYTKYLISLKDASYNMNGDGTTLAPGGYKVRSTNPDLKWETKTTFNLGADIGLFANRLMLTAEYYYSKTTDMLYAYEVPVPPFAYNTLLANIGSMSNRGFELGLSVQPISKKDMDLNINMNLSFQSNKLISLSGDYKGMSMSAANITAIGSLDGAGQNGGDNNVVYQIVGQPLGVFYLPHCKGLVKNENGSYFYDIEDLDHNGKVDLSDGGDRYIAGQATPKVILGSNISFRYKNYYISIQMNGAFGHKIFNGTGLAYTSMACFPDYNVFKDAPKKNIIDQRVSDYWLEKGDYLNFEHLTIGYNVPLRSKLIRSLRVSCNISNIGTITGYKGLTPMINSYVVNSTMGIDDKRNYPLYRTYSLGLSVQF